MSKASHVKGLIPMFAKHTVDILLFTIIGHRVTESQSDRVTE